MTVRRSTIAAILVASAATMAACGGTPAAAPTAVKSPPPGPGDAAICKVVTNATVAFDAKQYSAWKLYMAQVGTMAGSARYIPIKTDAEALKSAYDKPHKTRSLTGLNTFFGGLGGYQGLTKVCKEVHLS